MVYPQLFTINYLLDMFSNALCVMLTYKFAESDYYACCGCIDVKIKSFIKQRKVKENMEKEIHVISMKNGKNKKDDKHHKPPMNMLQMESNSMDTSQNEEMK